MEGVSAIGQYGVGARDEVVISSRVLAKADEQFDVKVPLPFSSCKPLEFWSMLSSAI